MKISDILLLVGVTILLFSIVFRIVGSACRNINSALKSHAASRKYRMMATTACSPSLEGKNYWILQSLPLEKKTIYQGWRGDEVRNG